MAKNSTWMPMTAGILDIICGCWALLLALVFIFVGSVTRFVPDVPQYLFPIFTAFSVPFSIIGILAIVGGVYALKRKIWGLALAGSIASLFSIHLFLLGIAAIVLTAMSKSEFK